MTAVLASGIMEFNSDSPLQHHVGVLKQEHHVASQSRTSQVPAWGKHDALPNTNKRRLSNGKTYTVFLGISERICRQFRDISLRRLYLASRMQIFL
jgi:hypothetical protein